MTMPRSKSSQKEQLLERAPGWWEGLDFSPSQQTTEGLLLSSGKAAGPLSSDWLLPYPQFVSHPHQSFACERQCVPALSGLVLFLSSLSHPVLKGATCLWI